MTFFLDVYYQGKRNPDGLRFQFFFDFTKIIGLI